MPGGSIRSDATIRGEAADWSALIHDEGAAFDRAAFEAWRAADPRHAAAFARVERGWQHAGLLAQTSYGRSRTLRGRDAPVRRGRGMRYAVAALIAVAALAGLVMAVPVVRELLWHSGSTELTSPVGRIRTLALADGSHLTLDTDSAIELAYSGAERRLRLIRGRARFAVAHDPARPFTVETPDGSVTAHGTLFDVDLTDGRTEVTLLRGLVEVRRRAKPDTRGPAAATLRPGQRIVLTGSGPLPAVAGVAPSDAQWTSGMLSFDRTPLVEAVAEANRYSTVKIGLADPSLDTLRVTGAFHARDTTALAQSLATSLALDLGRDPAGNFVLSPRSPDARDR